MLRPGGLDLSYLSVCTSLSVPLVHSLLIKDITRLWPNDTVQISNMKYAFGVQVHGEVLYHKFYSVFSAQLINKEILLNKSITSLGRNHFHRSAKFPNYSLRKIGSEVQLVMIGP